MPNDWDENDSGEVSRRDFLDRASSGAAFAAAGPNPTHHTGFEPDIRPVKLSDNLFLLEDTCNVYIIPRNGRAVLVDFGSVKILQHLADLGVSKVDWVLHPHHHRDQAQG